MSGPARVIRTDPTVDFSWGYTSPALGLPSNRFSVRWTGQLEAPSTGAYKLATQTDGGVRVWLDGAKVIDQWTAHPTALHSSGTLNLTAGRRYALRVEYYEVTGTAIARLMWEYPGVARQIVPQARLFPPDTTYLSDMPWISATSSLGPVERDLSVGGSGTGDGKPIMINGVKFAKGLGTRAPSEIRYALNNRYTDFSVSIGIDDAVPFSSGRARFQIFRDGVKAYESPTMGGYSAARYVEVDVTGVNELKLVVVDSGGGQASDLADWADAQVWKNERPHLTDFTWKSMSNGWGPAELDQSNGERAQDDGRMLSIAKQVYARGLGVHASSDVRYDLAGRFTRFTSMVGVDDEVPAGQGSVIFQVFVDGVKLFESPMMKSGDAAKPVDLDVNGKRELRLVVLTSINNDSYDHADWADARLTRGVVVPPSLPGAPSGLSAEGLNDRVNLSWKAATGATGYRIFRSTTANATNAQQIGTSNDLEHVDRNVNNGTKYYYKVVGVNPVGAGPASNEASATPNQPAPALPGAPTSLSARLANGKVSLDWDNAPRATSYNVYRRTAGGAAATTPLVTGVNRTNYVDETAASGTQYYYKVAGVNVTGIGPMSNEATTTTSPLPPATPTGLTAAAGDKLVKLTWNAVQGAVSYNVYRNGNNGPIASGLAAPTFTDTSVVNGTRYTYAVASVNGGGVSAPSAPVTATPQSALPAAPTRLSATAGDKLVRLAWNSAAGATSYSVFRNGASAPVASGITAANFTDTNLTNGTKYTYTVAGVNNAGTGPKSNQVEATPNPALPPAPSGLSAKAGDKEVTLTWNAAAGAATYNVYRNGAAAPVATGIAATTFVDKNLNNGTKYTYTVAGVNTAGIGAKSNPAEATPNPALPPAPSGLSAKAGDKEVTLTWNAAAGSATYNVYRNGAAAPVATGVTATTYVDKNLTNGTKYTYTVAGVNTAGIGAKSNPAEATPQSALPAAPSGLSAKAGDKEVTLTWTAAARATTYNVFRDGNATPVATGISAVTFVDKNLTNGTKYTYTVAGVNSAGTGPMSNQTNATPAAPIPPAPTGLSATAGDKQVSLAWTAAANATSYNVYRNGAAAPVASGITDVKYTDTNLTNGTKYTYTVAGVNGTGTGPKSNPAEATPQVPAAPAPTNFTATAGDRQVSLAWAAAPGATTYNVYRATSGGTALGTPLATNISGTTYIDSNLTNGTAHYYRVAGVNGAGVGAASIEASATPQVPLPVIPTGLTATSGDREVRLSWTLVPGAATYNLYRALTANGQGATPLVSGLTAPSHIDTGLTNGTRYFYKVAAVNAAGTSALSTEASSIPNPVTQPPSDAIHRFLRQSSWGPTPATMDRVRQIGIDAYLDEQFNTAATPYPDTLLTMPLEWSQEQMVKNAMSGQDQLRQRVAWALHKIWVVSGVEVSDARAFLHYYRTILNGSFGNYFDLMRNVTLTPAMGEYLDMVNNFKATPGNEPNENYARELMQLFTIGLVQLNPDGTVPTDGTGAPIPTYGQDDVLALARALTGWTYGDTIAGNPNGQNGRNYNFPMEPVESLHDTGSKTFLGQFVPAGQTATQDLDRSLQIIFNHPNVGPFICKNLIQQLVTSNPSPAYVQRVAGVFANNGSGVRGDLRAVVRAILKDTEAALGQPTSGHLREPVLFMTNVLRSLNATVADHPILTDGSEEMAQRIFYSPSVFSYFSPNFRVNGVPGPEFQIYTTFTALRRPNWIARLLNGGYGADIVIDYTSWTAAAADVNTLVDLCNSTLMGGQMSAQMRQSIVTAVNASPSVTEKVRTALYLTLTSSQYQVEH